LNILGVIIMLLALDNLTDNISFGGFFWLVIGALFAAPSVISYYRIKAINGKRKRY